MENFKCSFGRYQHLQSKGEKKRQFLLACRQFYAISTSKAPITTLSEDLESLGYRDL